MTTLHKNALRAGMTVEKRQEIRRAEGSAAELAKRFGCSIATIRRWKNPMRDSIEDRSHRPKQVSRALSLEQREAICEVMRRYQPPLDTLVAWTQAFFNPTVSRSTVHEVIKGLQGLKKAGLKERRRASKQAGIHLGQVRLITQESTQRGGVLSRLYYYAYDSESSWLVFQDESVRVRPFLADLSKKFPTGDNRYYIGAKRYPATMTPTDYHEALLAVEPIVLPLVFWRALRDSSEGGGRAEFALMDGVNRHNRTIRQKRLKDLTPLEWMRQRHDRHANPGLKSPPVAHNP